MNEDSPGGIQASHSELEAQYAEPEPVVVWACSCGFVLKGEKLQILIGFFSFEISKITTTDHQSDV